jgi:hypothetical protein
VQSFYTSIITFFGRHHSLEGCEAIARFVIRPFVSALDFSVNRLVSNALLFVTPSILEMLVHLVIGPILFQGGAAVPVRAAAEAVQGAGDLPERTRPPLRRASAVARGAAQEGRNQVPRPDHPPHAAAASRRDDTRDATLADPDRTRT